jgi:hypothetical protein
MSSNITDWYDLSDEEKSQVASQIYSPIGTCQMSSRQDLHEKIDVSVDHRAARIDARLADIIRWLWGNGIETTGCCENSLGKKIDGSESAWISFLSFEYGADRFTKFLNASNIHSVVTKRTCAPRFRVCVATPNVMLRLAVVNFRPDDIERIRKAIAAARRSASPDHFP